MELKIIFFYCLCNDVLKALCVKDGIECKMSTIVSENGVLMEFLLTPASYAYITALKEMEIDLREPSILYRDRAYNSQILENELLKIANSQ